MAPTPGVSLRARSEPDLVLRQHARHRSISACAERTAAAAVIRNTTWEYLCVRGANPLRRINNIM